MADYLTTDTELTSIADAIRTKGGTGKGLLYPAGFVSAINAIPTGGGGDEYTILNNSGYIVDLFINNSGYIDTTSLDDGDEYSWQAGTVAAVYCGDGEISISDGDVTNISPDGQTYIFVMPDFGVTLTA